MFLFLVRCVFGGSGSGGRCFLDFLVNLGFLDLFHCNDLALLSGEDWQLQRVFGKALNFAFGRSIHVIQANVLENLLAGIGVVVDKGRRRRRQRIQRLPQKAI